MSDFFAWYQTATAATPSQQERIARIDTYDATIDAATPAAHPHRLVPDRDGVIVCSDTTSDPYRLNADLSVDWTFTRPASNLLTFDAASDNNGGVYLAYQWNADARIYRRTNAGSVLFATITASSLGWGQVQPESICLSRDGTVLLVLAVNTSELDDVRLIGVSVATGSVLWTLQLAAATPSTFSGVQYATVRLAPSGNAAYASYLGVASGYDRPRVARVAFGSGWASAPSVAWEREPAADSDDRFLSGMTVTSNAVVVGYQASSTGGGDPHIATAFDEDGDVLWRYSNASFAGDDAYVDTHSLAWGDYGSGGFVLAGVYSPTVFSTEGFGLTLLDDTSGQVNSFDVWPLEVYLSGPVAAGEFTDWASTPVIQEATSRVRSNVSVDAGSILRATRLAAVEADVTEDFLEATTLDQTQLKAFREAMAPDDIALVYYPAGVQNNERLNTYAGETILGRMALTYPPRIMDTVANLSGGVDTAWSLTSALTYIFEQWATEYPWFRYEDVPDLRMARPDGDYSDGAGTPSTAVIGIPQSESNRKTMRDIVDEFLSAVPGAVLTASATGELRIVPRDGPDADAAPFKTLDGDDAYQVSTGFPDQRSSVNGAIGRNRGWTKEEAVSVMQPSWFSVRQAGTPSDRYLTPPSNVLDLTTSTLLGATAAPGIWPVADEDTLLDTDAVLSWTDPDTTDLLITGHVRYYNYPSGPVDETNDTTHSELNFENVTDLVLDGAWHEVFTLRRTFASGAHQGFHVTMDARFNEEQGGIEFRVSDAKLSGGFWDGATYYTSGQATFGITLDALGNRWGNSVTKTARFTLANGNTLIGEGGTNALEDSVAAYGERVDTINISVFDLDPETLGLIAQAHVLRNINPTTTRTVEQSAWRAFPVKFDDVGRLIQLPSGEEGYVLNRRYSDDFGIDYADGSLSSSIDVEVVTTSDQLLGDTSGFLFSDDGSLFVMDDGNPSEVN